MPAMALIDPFASPSRSMSARMESLWNDSSPEPVGAVKFEVNKLRAIGDMTAPVVPNSAFRERSVKLRNLEDDKNALIDDLIRQLETCQHSNKQLRLDNDREVKAIQDIQFREEALQQEMTAIRNLLDRNTYITVLIDGDALTFPKELWNDGEKGGLQAAQYLANALRTFAETSLPHLPSLNIHAKLFMNVKAMTDVLTRLKFVEKPVLVEHFLRGLVNSNFTFDVIDTSFCRGLTIKKLQDSYRHDFVNVHCHQIFLAALANDNFNALLDEMPDIPVHERVTLLEAKAVPDNEKFGHEIQSIKISEVFVRVPTEATLKQPLIAKMATPVTKIATPVLARVESNSSSKTMNSGQTPSSTSTPLLSWAAMTAQPFIPKPGEISRGSTPLSMKIAAVAKPPSTTVPRNKHGERVDTVDESIPYQELQRIKKMKLCNIYYLQGKNYCDGSCNHSHSYPLRSHEKNILKEVARMTPCHYRLDCDDPGCIYGHRCPQSKPGKTSCFYKDDCRFTGWGHGIDDNIVKTHNIK